MVNSMTKILKIIAEEFNAEEFINILPASEFIPEWYRQSPIKTPQTFSELSLTAQGATNSTYKRCTPFFDAMTSGYIAYLTADIEVIQRPNGTPFIANRTNRLIVSDHSEQQWIGLPEPSGYHRVVYKWHNQFSFNSPEGYSLLFTQPINRFDLPFLTVTGIVDVDKWDLQVHYPFFIRQDFHGIIEKGTPIVQIIPIKRENWERKFEPYEEKNTSSKLDKFYSTIKRSYKNNYWTKKEYK